MKAWDAIPLTTWRRLLATVVEDGGFDLESAALDVGLDGAETEALKAWCAAVETAAAGRRFRAEMAPSTIRFIESLLPDLDPGQRAAAEAELATIKKKPRT